jgi:hypothetical protein
MLLPSRTVGLKSEVPRPPFADQPALPDPQDLVLRIQKDNSTLSTSRR